MQRILIQKSIYIEQKKENCCTQRPLTLSLFLLWCWDVYMCPFGHSKPLRLLGTAQLSMPGVERFIMKEEGKNGSIGRSITRNLALAIGR